MLLLILLVLFYIFVEQKSIKVSAAELVHSYCSNIREADKKYLNKEIELTGKIKTYYEFEKDNNLLELQSEDEFPGVFIILKSKNLEEEAKLLTANTAVKVYGKCLGIITSDTIKFPESIYIEANELK